MQVMELIVKRIAAIEDAFHSHAQALERIEERLKSVSGRVVAVPSDPPQELIDHIARLEARITAMQRAVEDAALLDARVEDLARKAEAQLEAPPQAPDLGNELSAIGDRLVSLEARQETILEAASAPFARLVDRMEALEQEIAALRSTPSQESRIADRIDVLERRMEMSEEALVAQPRSAERVEVVEERVSALEGLVAEFRSFTDHVIAHEAQLAGCESRIEAQAVQLGGIEEQVAGYSSRFEIAERQMAAHRVEMNAIEERVSATADQVNAHSEQLTVGLGRVSAHAEQLQATAERLGRHDERFDEFGQRASALEEKIESAAVAMDERARAFAGGVQEQVASILAAMEDQASMIHRMSERETSLQEATALATSATGALEKQLEALSGQGDEHARELMILAERLAGVYEKDAEQSGARRHMQESMQRNDERLVSLEARMSEVFESVSISAAARLLDRVEAAEQRLDNVAQMSERIEAVVLRVGRVEEMAAGMPSLAEQIASVGAAPVNGAAAELPGDAEQRLAQMAASISTLRSKFEMLDSIRSVLAASDVDASIEALQERIAKLDAQIATLFTLNRVAVPQEDSRVVVRLEEE